MKHPIIGLLITFSSCLAIGMESNSWPKWLFNNIVTTDIDKLSTMLSHKKQKKKFGDAKIQRELAQRYHKALEEVSTPSGNIYYMTEPLAKKAEEANIPAFNSTYGTWIHPKLFHEKSEQKQEQILRFHAYAHAHHHIFKQVMMPIISFYCGLSTLLYSSIRLIVKKPTRFSLGLWTFGTLCTALGDQLKFGPLGKKLTQYYDKKAHAWSNQKYGS
jgi:hypothetical protein